MNGNNSQVVSKKSGLTMSKIALAAAAALGLGALTNSARANDRIEDRPRYEHRDGRVWISQPVYQTVCEKVWVAPVYQTVCEQVWVEPVVQDVCDKVWCPDRYEMRDVVSYDRYGHRICRSERVLVERGHFDEVHKQVVVTPGHFDKVERQVLVSEGHFENVEKRELVSAGHWLPHPEERREIDFHGRYERNDRGSGHVGIDLSYDRRR